MNARGRLVQSVSLALVWMILAAGPGLAHNGEDHGHGGMTASTWLAIAGVVLLVVLVYRLVASTRGEAGMHEHDVAANLDER